MQTMRAVFRLFIACLFFQFHASLLAETPPTTELELKSTTQAPIQWRVVGVNTGFRSNALSNHDRITLPLGDYDLQVKTISANWHAYKRLALRKSDSYQINIDTGLTLTKTDYSPPITFFIYDNSNRQILRVKNKVGFVPLPPGQYTAKIQIKGQGSQLQKVVTITDGSITNVNLDTGVLVKADNAPAPQRWELKPITKGSLVVVQNRWGVALAEPGEYTLSFMLDGQSTVKYQRVSVKKGKISVVNIDSGILLQSAIKPERFKLVSQDKALRLQSSNLDVLFAPPGTYSLSVKMPNQGYVHFKDNIEIKHQSIKEISVDSGALVKGDGETKFTVSIHSKTDNRQIAHLNDNEGFIPLPPGQYRLYVKTSDQTRIAYQDFEVKDSTVSNLSVNTGFDLKAADVFGAFSDWNLKSLDDDTLYTTTRRWGKAVAPAGRYKLTVTMKNGSKIDFGTYSVSKHAWRTIVIDNGLHITNDEVTKNGQINIYRQGDSKLIYTSKSASSHIPLPPGKYRITQTTQDGYFWGRPFTINPGEITHSGKDLLRSTNSSHAAELAAGNSNYEFSIAQTAMNGSIKHFSSQNKEKRWHADKLIDGFAYFEHMTMGNRCEKSCGWMSKPQPVDPPEVTIGFHQERKAWVSAFVFESAFSRKLDETKHLPRHVTILASNETPNTGFRKVIDVLLKPVHRPQLILLPKEIPAKFVKIRVMSSYGGNQIRIGEIRIIEASNKPSITADIPKDLARPENGGSIAWFTSQKPGNPAAQLVWQGDEYWPDPWHSFKGPEGDSAYLPQDVVFGFRHFQIASIDHITIDPSGLDLSSLPMGLDSLAKEIVIERSMSLPTSGFMEITRVHLESNGQPVTVKIDKKARFIKFRVVSKQGNSSFVKLGKISIFETIDSGEKSILKNTYSKPDASNPEQSGTVAQLSGDSEMEPNNSQSSATPLATGRWMTGIIDPLSEDDYYRFSLAKPSVVTTQLLSKPYIQEQLNVLDERNHLLYQFSPDRSFLNQEQFSLKLNSGNYYYRLTQAPNSIVLIWDTSGSMEGSEKALEKAVMGFIDEIRASEKLQLIRFGDGVKVLTDTFTDNIGKLKQAARDQFTPIGGTPLYESIATAMELLEEQSGNKAIVLMTDGSNTGNRIKHEELWHKVKRENIRFYTVGLGYKLNLYSPKMGATGQQFLDYLALATSGKNLRADNSDQLKSLYLSVAKEITTRAPYSLRISTDDPPGLLALSTRDKMLSAATSAVFEIVLDASGSMVSTHHLIDDKLKIDAAKQILIDIVNDLPVATKLGFRVFGHRIKEYQPGDCQDTELMYHLKPHKKAELHNVINSVVASNGTTPLSFSILQAAKDLLGTKGQQHIVLVTDGQEYCGADPKQVVQKLMDLGINIRIDIVGMDLKKRSLREDMQTIAQMTHGEFYNIKSSETFRKAIQSSISASYLVKDDAGRIVATGNVNGRPVKVPPGSYHLAVKNDDKTINVGRINVRSDRITRIDIVKNGQLVEPASITTDKFTRDDWTSAKSADIDDHSIQLLSLAEKRQHLEQLERQVIAATADRPAQ